MKNKNIYEAIVTICLVVVAVLLLNPFGLWMPDMVVTVMLVIALILFGFFSSFIVREKVVDERDGAHRTLAGRNAFLVGSATILIGIIIEAYSHSVDPWLVIALIVMIIVKMGTRIWSDRNL